MLLPEAEIKMKLLQLGNDEMRCSQKENFRVDFERQGCVQTVTIAYLACGKSA